MKSVSERCLEEGRTFFCQERLDKMREKKIAQIYIYIYIYIENTKLDGLRGVKL